MRKPLEGLFVVEMTSYWSATTTARFLRDMGARVVRVETPPIGDFCRYYGRSMGMPITAEENPIHSSSCKTCSPRRTYSSLAPARPA